MNITYTQAYTMYLLYTLIIYLLSNNISLIYLLYTFTEIIITVENQCHLTSCQF